jgi:uncharacterized membrane protein HdeD (DUF308 family)
MRVLTRPSVLDSMARNWWTFVVRGIIAILFGIVALVWPALTLGVLIILFGAYAIVDGVISIVSGVRARDTIQWSLVLWGIVGIAAGVVAFLWPDLTALALVYVIAAWAVITGVIEIVAAIALRREISDEWLLVIIGALSVVVGVLMFLFPGAGALSIVWLIGAYAIGFGILLLIAGVRFRGWQQRSDVEAGSAA